MIKLPQGMTGEVANTLKILQRTIAETIFKTLLVKNLKDEKGSVVPLSIKPRIIVFFAENEAEMDQAMTHLIHFMGDAFDYELSTGYSLPLESETNELDHLKIRARILNASDMSKVFTMVGENKEPVGSIMEAMFFSKFLIKVDRVNLPVMNHSGFEATTKILPSAGAYFRARNMITSPSIVSAFETAVRNPEFNFENEIDKNFDTIMISVDGKAMELPLSTANNDGLVSLFTKMVLNAESVAH